MGPRFTLSLLGVIILATIIGVVAGRSQPPISAAPVPTNVPTAIPHPSPNHISIVPNSTRNPTARYLSSNGTSSITVHIGQKLTWANTDSLDHTVTADNRAFDSGVLSPHQSFSWTAKKPGRYPYACFIHPDLHGEVIVQP